MGPDFCAEIETHDKLWKVVWIADNLRYPRAYYVDPVDLNVKASTIRGILRRLVTLSTVRGALTSGGGSETVPLLNQLITEGHRLYEFLFTDEKGDDQATADQVRQDIANCCGRPRIWFKVTSDVNIPWALMSETDAPVDDEGTPASYSHLWALKYSVATLYSPLVGPNRFAASYRASDFETLMGVDPGFHQKANDQLGTQCPEAQVFARLAQPVVDPKTLLGEWRRRESRLGLLYLYVHASPETLGFAAEDLQAVDFKSDFKKQTVSPPCLVFLNGCHTAAGRFLASTGRRGFCGLIGVETVVPYMFAHRFGAAVIASLYAGELLGASLDRLRVQHWPLSLVYGLYAYPFLKLVPSFVSPQLPDSNYSSLTVGDETM